MEQPILKGSDLKIKVPQMSQEVAKDITLQVVDELKRVLEQVAGSNAKMTNDIFNKLTNNIIICYYAEDVDVVDDYNSVGGRAKTWTYYNLGLANFMASNGGTYRPAWNIKGYKYYALFKDEAFGQQVLALLPKKLTGKPRTLKRADVSTALYMRGNKFREAFNNQNKGNIAQGKNDRAHAKKDIKQQAEQVNNDAINAWAQTYGKGKAPNIVRMTNSTTQLLDELNVAMLFTGSDAQGINIRFAPALSEGVQDMSNESIVDVKVSLLKDSNHPDRYFSSTFNLSKEQESAIRNYVEHVNEQPDIIRLWAKALGDRNSTDPDNQLAMHTSERFRQNSANNWHPQIRVNKVELVK